VFTELRDELTDGTKSTCQVKKELGFSALYIMTLHCTICDIIDEDVMCVLIQTLARHVCSVKVNTALVIDTNIISALVRVSQRPPDQILQKTKAPAMEVTEQGTEYGVHICFFKDCKQIRDYGRPPDRTWGFRVSRW
jgi:hypothetical protein